MKTKRYVSLDEGQSVLPVFIRVHLCPSVVKNLPGYIHQFASSGKRLENFTLVRGPAIIGATVSRQSL